MISLLVAHDANRVIGHNNQMPWHIPEELAYFKKVSMGKAMIMGRKTFESIGRPLPGRLSIVVTRNMDYTAEGIVVAHDIDDAIQKAKDYSDEVVVIGGAEIFQLVLEKADRLYVTSIENKFEGDTYFPEYGDEWILKSTSEKQLSKDGIRYTFLILERDSV